MFRREKHHHVSVPYWKSTGIDQIVSHVKQTTSEMSYKYKNTIGNLYDLKYKQAQYIFFNIFKLLN